MSMGLIILCVIALVFAFWFFSIYNKFIRLIEAIKNSEKEISVQLDRRGKVFDSLINSVNKIMRHEENVFTRITELRSKTTNSNSLSQEDVKNAEDELSKIVAGGELSKAINFTMENYPEIKSNTNMEQLQEEIVNTENKLTFAKKAYNNNIETYNVKKSSIPDFVVVKIFKNINKNFEYWQLTEEQVKVEENRRVEF